MPYSFYAQFTQLLANPLRVGVESLSAGEFVTDSDYFCMHDEFSFRPDL